MTNCNSQNGHFDFYGGKLMRAKNKNNNTDDSQRPNKEAGKKNIQDEKYSFDLRLTYFDTRI